MKEVEKVVKVVKVIQSGRKFLVTSHENPDGDAIGSMLALGLGLESLGKEVTLYNKDGTPKNLSFLPGVERVSNSLNRNHRFDATFIVDCASLERVGKDFKDFRGGGTQVLIDHHATNTPWTELFLIDPESPSTGALVYSLLEAIHVEITPEIATNIYTIIMLDTGSFHYQNSTPEAFRAAARMVEMGANPWEVSQAFYENESPGRISLLGLVLPTLEVSEDGRIASVTVKKEMLSATGTSREDTEGFVNYPRSLSGVMVAVLFREEEEGWKVSLRSKDSVNVAEIAVRFGGGGHERAAGCTISGDLHQVKKRLYKAIGEFL